MGEVKSIDSINRKVVLEDEEFTYDYLIVAIGSRHSYFGKDEWEKYAPGLKTMDDALQIRERILLAFEKAERLNEPDEIKKYLTFVIVGGGPTGVELAGAISEIARKTMLKDFRNIDTTKTNVILVEAADRLLNQFDPDLSNKAKEDLENLGVKVLLNNPVTSINETGVYLCNDVIETNNIIWAAGNKISRILNDLDAEYDRAGRVIVEPDCSIKKHPEIFVIGDAALFKENEKVLPAIAPVAIQQGKYVAKIISRGTGKDSRTHFKYFDKGIMATIGKAKAVMQISNFKATGLFAWLSWVFVHILYLISFRNRYKVLVEWIWLYITNRNGIRLITQKHKM
jgi:NADH dehydrogenase